jgi:hypothetical protein
VTTWDDIRTLMHTLDIPPPSELRCGRAAWDVFRSGIKTDRLGAADPLWGIPVHIDRELPDGAWKLLEDGKVIHEGDMMPGQRWAVYIGGVGLAAISDETTADEVYARLNGRRAGEHTEGHQ